MLLAGGAADLLPARPEGELLWARSSAVMRVPLIEGPAGGASPPAGPRPPGEISPVATQDAWLAYRAALLRFVRRRVEDDAAAEDLVQDVLLRALTRRDSVRGPLEPWLYRVARNAIVDHYRARRPHEPIPDALAGEAPGRDARGELAACLEPLVRGLPARYREAVALADLEGLTQRETASRLGLTLSGAKSRVQRGRARVRELLLRCCRIELDHRGVPVDYDRIGGRGAPACGGCAA